MFLSRSMAPQASGDDRSPFGSFWFEPVSVRSMTGVRVSAETAMRLSAVYAAVRLLAETFAVLPFGLLTVGTDRMEPVRDHWLLKLLKRPNDWQNGFEWREMMMGHLALRGNAYNRKVFDNRGNITSLIPLHPDRMRPEILSNGDYRFRLRQADGSDDILPRDEVWHIRGLSSDGITGLSPLEIARETIGLGIAAQEYGARFFQNDARPGGGWIEFPGNFKDRAARDTFRETWQGAQSGANRHKTAVLEMGMKYHELAIKNNDAQFLETRKFQVTDIARIFRVPPHLIADLDRSTNNNIEQQSLEFVTYTMTPWAERWEASIENDLLLDSEGLEAEFDFENLLRADQQSRAEFYSSGITAGWLTRNEARRKERMNPILGLDEPLSPVNLQTTDQAEAADAAAPPARRGGQKALPSDEADAPDARLLMLARSTAERVARRELAVMRIAIPKGEKAIAEAYRAHENFVAACLGVSEAAAAAYCAVRVAAVKPEYSEIDFECLAIAALERLALKGNIR